MEQNYQQYLDLGFKLVGFFCLFWSSRTLLPGLAWSVDRSLPTILWVLSRLGVGGQLCLGLHSLERGVSLW